MHLGFQTFYLKVCCIQYINSDIRVVVAIPKKDLTFSERLSGMKPLSNKSNVNWLFDNLSGRNQ